MFQAMNRIRATFSQQKFQLTTDATFTVMKQQQQTRASPEEGMTTLQKMVAETVEYYLANGGAEVARAEIKYLASTFSFKDDWPQAYRWAMARIDAFEKAERIRAEEREQQRMGNMMMTMMGIAQQSASHEKPPSTILPKPDLSDSNICRCLRLLMEEQTDEGEPLFNQKSNWQAVFRILSDADKFADDDFDGFDSWVHRVVPPELTRLYSKQSVKNISQTLFNKPFKRWAYDPRLMKKREPYDRMEQIAGRFRELLGIQD